MAQASPVNSADGPPAQPLGRYLARRLVQFGVNDVFSVAGDLNRALLDDLAAEPTLRIICCCNELSAGYAADGYARARGVGACAVAASGGLSIINAIAGAYADDLPVICIVGGPDSVGISGNPFAGSYRCFETVTCSLAVVEKLEDACELIDATLLRGLEASKPVCISFSRGLLSATHASFAPEPFPLSSSSRFSDPTNLERATEAAANILNRAVKPVLVGGPRLRACKAQRAFEELANACGYPVAVLPSGKGFVREHHPQFIGTYWGPCSAPFCQEIVESADAHVFVGPVFSEFALVGHSVLLHKERALIVEPNRTVVGNGALFGRVFMAEFLAALAKKLKKNSAALEIYHRIFVPPGVAVTSSPSEPLRLNVIFKHIQGLLSEDTVIIAETGDSMFHCQKLRLPDTCGYESQLHYGSLGWAVGATLGYSHAARDKRVIAFIGDGGFQVTAQDISTMICCGHRSMIFLVNNGGYSTEIIIHDGPYNVIKNWNYTGFVDAICNGKGRYCTMKAKTEEELIKAIEVAKVAEKYSLCFIEVIVDKYDTSKELLIFAARISSH